jgi:glucose-6-phosphate isomerase/transaldolase/glucose-6-phosphate isomerase
MDTTGISFLLGSYQNAVTNALQKIRRSNIAARIWAHDFNVWKPAPDEISNRLAWLHAPVETLAMVKGIRSSLSNLTERTIRDVVLLGMGGSSLSAEVYKNMIGSKPGFPRLLILDTTDPVAISKVTKIIDLKQTLFLVASKSGKTLEVSSLFHYFYHLAGQTPDVVAHEHFIFITDEGSPMLELAWQLNISYVFSNNPNIGGRYSALSLAGIIPAVMIGIEVEKLLHKAAATANQEKADFFSGKNDSPGCLLGAALGVLAQYGRDKLTLIAPPHWRYFGDWLEQLVAESTGKEGKGIVPVINEPSMDVGVYGKDRVFVFFENGNTEEDPRITDLVTAGHPVLKIHIQDVYDLGSQMFLWEMATAVASHILGVNPFDQPDVEATKINTLRLIDDFKKLRTWTAEKPSISHEDYDIYGDISSTTASGVMNELLSQATVNAYVGIQVYASPTDEIDALLHDLRKAITHRARLATTIGYGPRYLHSTGQLHKGDAGRGLFIQITDGNETDMDIPDAPDRPGSSLTFGALKAAQAAADRQALTDLGRKIIRIHFKKDTAAGLMSLTKYL